MGLGQAVVCAARYPLRDAELRQGFGLVSSRIEVCAVDFCLILAEFGSNPGAAIRGQYEMRLADGIYSGCWNLMDV